ncbi:hypothetical protein KAR91_44515 [Candidatus Pacearchaeota archaeon]|nr:hypothetical protein [Candidatus Pacearchaeota archaeon]
MAVTYCTAAEVASLLRLIDGDETPSRLTFDETTDPTLAEVEDWINDAEDQIDNACRHAFREVQITNEYHDITLGQWRFGYEIQISARRSPLRTFVSGTDKIEIWRGDVWEDLISDANYTEGRNNDYFIAYETGIIFVRTIRPALRAHSIRLSYKHGEATVPRDIKRACILLTSLNILENDDYKIILPENTDKYAIESRISQYKKDIDKILGRHTVTVYPSS